MPRPPRSPRSVAPRTAAVLSLALTLTGPLTLTGCDGGGTVVGQNPAPGANGGGGNAADDFLGGMARGAKATADAMTGKKPTAGPSRREIPLSDEVRARMAEQALRDRVQTPAEFAALRVEKLAGSRASAAEVRDRGATVLVRLDEAGPVPSVTSHAYAAVAQGYAGRSRPRSSSGTGRWTAASGPVYVVHARPVDVPEDAVAGVPFLTVQSVDRANRVVEVAVDHGALFALMAEDAGMPDARLSGFGGRAAALAVEGVRRLRRTKLPPLEEGGGERAPEDLAADALRQRLFDLGPDGDPATDDAAAAGWRVGVGRFGEPGLHEPPALLIADPVPDPARWGANVRRALADDLSFVPDAAPPVLEADLIDDGPAAAFADAALEQAEEARRARQKAEWDADAAERNAARDHDPTLNEPAAGESGTDWAIRVLADAGEGDWVAKKRALEHLKDADPALAAEDQRDRVNRALATALPDAIEAGSFEADRVAEALFTWADSPGLHRAVGEALLEATGFGRKGVLERLDPANPLHAYVAAPLMTHRWEGDEALAFIRRMGPAAEPAVIDLLDDPSPETRRDVATLLTEFGGADAAAALQRRSEAETDRTLAKHLRAQRLEIMKKLR